MKKYDIIIVGSGISGLSFAHYCSKQGLRVVVLEKQNQAGGSFYSHRFNLKGKHFWLEMGAHTCYNSYRNLLEIIEDCGLNEQMISRKKVPFRMLLSNELKSITSQINFWEILPRVWRILTLEKSNMSIQSYYTKILGEKNFTRTFFHVMNAVPSQEAGEFPADFLFKKRPRRKDVLKKFSFENGLQTITDSIILKNNIELLTKMEVMTVEFAKKKFRVSTQDEENFESPYLVLATPPTTSSRILKKIFPDISKLLAGIKVGKVDSVGIAVEKDRLNMEEVASIIPLENDFYSIVSRDIVEDENFRGFTFHFKHGVWNKKEKLKRISRFLKVPQHSFSGISLQETSIPSPRLGHYDIVKAIDGHLYQKKFFLTGNYFYGMAIEDCVSRSLSEFRRLGDFL